MIVVEEEVDYDKAQDKGYDGRKRPNTDTIGSVVRD